MTTVVLALAICGWAAATGLGLTNRARAQSLRTAAHEIRGPLCALHLGLHAGARRLELTPSTVSALELELRRIAMAVDDAVGNPRRSAAPVDLDALLECQARTWGDVAAAHGSTVSLNTDTRVGLARADAARLAQSIGNVLSNAIEHGGGAIELRASCERGRVRIEVTDGGDGLPAPIAQLVGGRRRGIRGRGLTIAKQAIESQGGSLCSLPSGRGARVALEIPLGPDSGAGADVA